MGAQLMLLNPGRAWHERAGQEAEELREHAGLMGDPAREAYFAGMTQAQDESLAHYAVYSPPRRYNPGRTWHRREAGRYGKRLAGDLAAGHGDAADYWQGALSAENRALAAGRQKNPRSPKLAHLSDEALHVRWEKLDRRLRTKGGGTFGYDWPTLKITDPKLYRELKEVIDEVGSRGLLEHNPRRPTRETAAERLLGESRLKSPVAPPGLRRFLRGRRPYISDLEGWVGHLSEETWNRWLAAADAAATTENPRRPTREFMARCRKGVKAGYDPGAVCASTWHKMSPAARRKWLARENPDIPYHYDMAHWERAMAQRKHDLGVNAAKVSEHIGASRAHLDSIRAMPGGRKLLRKAPAARRKWLARENPRAAWHERRKWEFGDLARYSRGLKRYKDAHEYEGARKAEAFAEKTAREWGTIDPLDPWLLKQPRRGNPSAVEGARLKRLPPPAENAYRAFHGRPVDGAREVKVPAAWPRKLWTFGRLVSLSGPGWRLSGGVLAGDGRGRALYIIGARGSGRAGPVREINYTLPAQSRRPKATYVHRFTNPPALRGFGGGFHVVSGRGLKLTRRGIVG